MYVLCKGITKEGIFCQNIEVELDLSHGLFNFLIVGLADKCITESRERIMSAIKNSGFDSPKTKNHKITVSLAPAGIKKEGVLLDLPISLAYLTATNVVSKESLNNSIFIGELGLDGSIKINDSLALVVDFILKDNEYKALINSGVSVKLFGNFKEHQIDLIKKLNLPNIEIYNIENLRNLIDYLNLDIKTRGKIGDKNNSEIRMDSKGFFRDEGENVDVSGPENESVGESVGERVRVGNGAGVDKNIKFEIDNIIGQQKAKRALLISICGKYNMIISGPPGIGKTMLAKSAHQLLPEPQVNEYLEILSIHNNLDRPFRSPHHTSSYSSIIGGGTPITSGEITKAHKGILFLDELPEFNRNIIESLRQPLEEKAVQINRSNNTITLPCDVICICAMNLCPCGNKGIPGKECVCAGNKIKLYRQKVSEPFLERFHISISLSHESHFSRGMSADTKDTTGVDTMSGSKMRSIINKFTKIRPYVDFKWGSIESDMFSTASKDKGLSMRSIKHTQEISETISLIESIQSEDFNKQAPKIEIIVKKHHIIEAFSYKNALF